MFLSLALADKVDRRGRCSAPHGRQIRPRPAVDAFNTPEPRILGPLSWLLWVAPLTCVFRNCERSSSAVRWCPLARLVTEECPNDHGRFKPDLPMLGAVS